MPAEHGGDQRRHDSLGDLLHGGGHHLSFSVSGVWVAAAVAAIVDSCGCRSAGGGGSDDGAGTLVSSFRGHGVFDLGLPVGCGIDEDLLAKSLLFGGTADVSPDLDAGRPVLQHRCLAGANHEPRKNPLTRPRRPPSPIGWERGWG